MIHEDVSRARPNRDALTSLSEDARAWCQQLVRTPQGASTVNDYAYDGGGNRILSKETTGTVVKNLTTTYDAAGLPTSATDATTGETVSYTNDAIGDLKGIDSSIAANDWTSFCSDPSADDPWDSGDNPSWWG